jgi:lipopolysaccharide/colanic/teichoic acid biosynthesis glycosyltransferase
VSYCGSRRKRALDVAVAGAALAVSAPALAVAAAAIRAESPGHPIYRQRRVGLDGHAFDVYKLRTMVSGAEGMGAGLAVDEGDDRITRVGAFLRRSKLDELAQLVDVLQGTMSMVGPRPEVPRYVALYPAELREVVLSVRPGLTDLASIEFRDEAALLAHATEPEREYVEVVMPKKLALAAQYVRTRTWGGDVRLIWRTLGVLWRRSRLDV